MQCIYATDFGYKNWLLTENIQSGWEKVKKPSPMMDIIMDGPEPGRNIKFY